MCVDQYIGDHTGVIPRWSRMKGRFRVPRASYIGLGPLRTYKIACYRAGGHGGGGESLGKALSDASSLAHACARAPAKELCANAICARHLVLGLRAARACMSTSKSLDDLMGPFSVTGSVRDEDGEAAYVCGFVLAATNDESDEGVFAYPRRVEFVDVITGLLGSRGHALMAGLRAYFAARHHGMTSLSRSSEVAWTATECSYEGCCMLLWRGLRNVVPAES